MSATAKTVTTSCSVADGMYVRTYTNLRLDAIATAFGQCQLVVPNVRLDVCASRVQPSMNGSCTSSIRG